MRKHFCFLFSSCFINALDKTFKDDVGGTANMERRLKMNAVLIAVSIVLSNYADFTQSCLWSERSLEDVSVCPDTEQGTQKAERIKKCEGLSVRQNCTINKLKFKYHCLYSYPSHELVEVCATEISVHGGCVVYDTKQSEIRHISTVKCGDSCPDVYMSSRAHLVAPCPSLENWTKNNPRDPDNITVSYTTEDRAIPTDTTTLMNVPNVTDTSTTVITPVEQESVDIGVIIGIVLAALFVLCIVLAVVFWRRRRRMRRPKRKKDREKRYSPVPESDMDEWHLKLRQYGDLESTSSLMDVLGSEQTSKKTDIVKEEIELRSLLPDPQYVLGEYAVWRTSISDQFSSLSDDEVCVLFCFLCSDSGTPDFTDTDWLDILHQIRWNVYSKKGVTTEEAQQTLDGLKLRDFLWDQDGVHLTEDVKDETMYRITERATETRKTLYPVYRFSSYTTAMRYLRSQEYTSKSGEKCVIGYPDCDSLLIRRLQMNILTHDTMEDTEIYDEVSRYLNIPPDIVRVSYDERRSFLEELKQTAECVHYRGGSQGGEQHVNWLWRDRNTPRPDIVRSCIGLRPHWDIYIINNTANRKHSQYHDRPPAERCLLYCLLMVDDYTVKVKDKSHIKVYNAIRERYFTDLPVCEEIPTPPNLEGIIHVENDVIKFKSDDIRHDVMYAFITECLVKESDLKFFLTTASRDVISEYCRSWDYERSEGERCLYLPYEMYDLFIDGIQLDILTHSAFSNRKIHGRIRERLKIPREVFEWDIEARRRYVKSSKEQGRKQLFYARGMLVGCAGAGKTSLLIKLQTTKTADKKQHTETTVGLEVHDELFQIESNELKVNKEKVSVFKSDKQLISMTDFAGQVAYYACHQVYLSRRAFYLLVVDMSKGLKEKVHLHNRSRHDPLGSLFHQWTYQEYFIFWLQCIKTYCMDGKTGRMSSPVIVIASHKDYVKKDTPNFFWKLKNSLPEGLSSSNLLSSDRYFEVECPPRSLNDLEKNAIENVKRCIVETVTQMPHWGEEIPLNWIKFVGILNKKKEEGVRILKRDELLEMKEIKCSTEEDLDDMLRFFQEIGRIIYFADEKLRDTVIINVQWFVDGFKHIITDRKHVPLETMLCDEWMKTGRIPESAFRKIWKDSSDESYCRHQNDILPYMQKLGLMTQKLKNSETYESMYYVPSMNRVDFSPGFLNIINEGHKTSILIFHFKTYLPHFFFFRLVVHCSAKWEELDPIMFCKNAAFYKTQDYSHCIAMAVNTTSILLQVFTPGKETDLQTENVVGIRSEVEKHVDEITTTFHEQVKYEIGYSCEEVAITDVEERHFLSEDQVLKFGESVRCPNHILAKRSHNINKRALIGFWRNGV